MLKPNSWDLSNDIANNKQQQKPIRGVCCWCVSSLTSKTLFSEKLNLQYAYK